MRITSMRIDLRRAIPARAYPLMVGVIALVDLIGNAVDETVTEILAAQPRGHLLKEGVA